jgi:hypothetical protein
MIQPIFVLGFGTSFFCTSFPDIRILVLQRYSVQLEVKFTEFNKAEWISIGMILTFDHILGTRHLENMDL